MTHGIFDLEFVWPAIFKILGFGIYLGYTD
jgi:hypothetical protein